MKQPMQPLVVDERGTVRFHENAIVRTLLDQKGPRPLDMNDLAGMGFSQEDETQFAQLIGYSVVGFHELPYVSDAAAAAASAAARAINPAFGGCRDDGCECHSGVAEEEE